MLFTRLDKISLTAMPRADVVEVQSRTGHTKWVGHSKVVSRCQRTAWRGLVTYWPDHQDISVEQRDDDTIREDSSAVCAPRRHVEREPVFA